MLKLLTVVLVAASLTDLAVANGDYWWMNQQEVFSGGQQQQQKHKSSGGYGGSSSSQASYGQSNNLPNYQQNQVSGNQVQDECPTGTKCVNELFCNENAVMVTFRVDLTPAQKKQRGNLIPCMNQQTGTFDVCCSKPAAPLPVNNQRQPSPAFQQQQQQQPSVPVSQGSCPNLGSLPDVANCNGAESNCWSVGQTDVDCPDNVLCCFDGCRNTCYFGAEGAPAPAPAPAPQPPAPVPRPPAPRPQPPQQQQQQQQQPEQQQQQLPQPQQPQPEPLLEEVEVEPVPMQTPAPPPPAQQQKFNEIAASSDECPSAPSLDASQCSAEKDTCWNVGGQDDCQRGFLCCNDGCVKTCYSTTNQQFLRLPSSQLNQGAGAPSPPRQQPAQRQPQQQPRPQTQFNQPRPQRLNQPQPQPQQSYQPQQQEQSYQPQQQQQNYQPPQQQQRRPVQQQQQTFQQPQQNFQSADTKPFVKCPAAMLCVVKESCDFNGVISDKQIPYNADTDTQRVPLISCINPDTQDINVCCRDPNYVDPWPQDNSGNNNNNNNNFDQGFSNNNQGNQRPAVQQQQPPRRSSNNGYGRR